MRQSRANDLNARTLGEAGARQLELLSAGSAFERDAPQIASMFQLLTASWRDQALADPPRWSALSADSSPLEFSLVLGGMREELRFTTEVQRDPASASVYWESSLELNLELR